MQLKSTQSRWLRVHAHADEEHGQQALALAERYVREDPDVLLSGAARACRLWQDIFRSALLDRIALPALKPRLHALQGPRASQQGGPRGTSLTECDLPRKTGQNALKK